MATLAERLRYTVTQAARVAWYSGQYAATVRLAGNAVTDAERTFEPQGQLPGWEGLRRGLLKLFERDWRNIAAGVYPAPAGTAPQALASLARTGRYFADLPAVTRRRVAGGHSEVVSEATRARYPRYYLQNFHFQTDGYLSPHSARLYDHQVEVLFTGAADAMRRQALVPLRQALVRRRPRPRLLDVATGTGRFLAFVQATFPFARVTGLDLSQAYLDQVRANAPRATLMHAKAEAIPTADASWDAVTCIYLFHELPPKVRRAVAHEIARVLKPGGRFVLVDSLQTGDVASYDGLLELFPRRFHEPYFLSYIETDLAALFAEAGLTAIDATPAFLSKVMTFEKS